MDIINKSITQLLCVKRNHNKIEVFKEETNISSWKGMLYYFPYKYTDRSKIYKIGEANLNGLPYIQLKGRIVQYKYIGEGESRKLSAIFDDGTGAIELIWFRPSKWISKIYKLGREYILFGKPNPYGASLSFMSSSTYKYYTSSILPYDSNRLQLGVSIAHPELEEATEFYEGLVGMHGEYSTTEKMKKVSLYPQFIKKMIIEILENIKDPLPETLPKEIIDNNQLMSLDEAIRNIHFPKSNDLLQQAQYRLKFEELFYLQLSILSIAKHREKHIDGFRFKKIGENFYFLKNNLHFELTTAQQRVVNEIWKDMNTGKQMNRLLQGDVGSGKTLIALLSILLATDNGFQGAIMVPTEVLAIQHYETISQMLNGSAVKVALLTGSTKNKLRGEMLPKVKSGEIQILIGTHALIEEGVEFNNLGLVIVDEQHRFGVIQRAKLWSKNSNPPHVLVMTATPIPRTLAMTIYGDLDVSIIDELPPGRKPVDTYHKYDEKRDKIYEYVQKEIETGKQIYIVYPLIEENEKIDLTNLQEGFQTVKERFPQHNVSMVHGQMNPEEKKQEMQKFLSGEAQIMVATTVIEVGIDVKNASVMIIENAERFGLSQLHQLRGRVGRGTTKSVCILITPQGLSEDAQKRITIMTKTNDGFTIAEEDLKLRGPGNLNGIKQSGFDSNLKIARLSQDGDILDSARNIARRILDDDPNLEKRQNIMLKEQLHKWNMENQTEWFGIS
ncbi:MAG: ATP-dependent DNA helicase RecG [Candidatus Azobacteroides pseudotrichonymphae]|nr:MAG: ATP-dependent DNA helicase RecG [Candidatus Azobacteroides pseudotrichonymphae]